MTTYEPSGPEIPTGARNKALINNWMAGRKSSERLHHPGDELVSDGFPARNTLGHRTLNYLLFSYSELIRYLQERINFFNSYDFVCKELGDLEKVLPLLSKGSRVRVDSGQKLTGPAIINKRNVRIDFSGHSLTTSQESAFRVGADGFRLSGCQANCKYLADYSGSFSFSSLENCTVPDLGQYDYWTGENPIVHNVNTSGIITSKSKRRFYADEISPTSPGGIELLARSPENKQIKCLELDPDVRGIKTAAVSFGDQTFKVSDQKKFLVNDAEISVKGDKGDKGDPGQPGKDRVGKVLVCKPFFKYGTKRSWNPDDESPEFIIATFSPNTSENQFITVYAEFIPYNFMGSFSVGDKPNFQVLIRSNSPDKLTGKNDFRYDWTDKDQVTFTVKDYFMFDPGQSPGFVLYVSIRFPAKFGFNIKTSHYGFLSVNCQPGMIVPSSFGVTE